MILFKTKLIAKAIITQSRFFVFATILYPFAIFYRYLKTEGEKKLWLIGENEGKCLYDNGYIFYKFCRTTHLRSSIYFIATEESIRNDTFLTTDENVIIHGSIKHIFFFLLADTLIYSHSQSDIGYIQLIKIFKRNCQRVFIQHGIIGLKKIDSTYRRKHNEMDIFIVSSDFEKNIVLKNFTFQEKVIKVTGLARYDNLIPCEIKKNSILYIPTWRNWIYSKKTASSYIKGIESLITNDNLLKILHKHDIVLIFLLHNKMKQYLSSINIPDQVFTCSNRPIQKYIKQCSMVITDYSSISWDFYYLRKPVLFYQFDQKEYLEKKGSYIDINLELFGEVFYDSDSLVTGLHKYILNNFNELSEYGKRRDLYFKYRDTNNCKRIFKVISSAS